MQKELDFIKEKITQKIFLLFIQKYKGNKSHFARDVGCNEKTIRRLFENNQGMTLNLFFKLAFALDVKPSELLEDIYLTKEEE